MILLLDTSSPTCRLALIDGEKRYEDTWEADRGLAKGLLGYIQQQLEKHDTDWNDLSGLVAFRGPGSFTGLRIGLTVLNTIAASQSVPIVGTTGEDWQQRGVERLENGEDDRLVMPEYGREANITSPRK